MNISDKEYKEFHNQIFERNKELIKENKELKQELEETELARQLCEGNWKRCEQELEQNKKLYDILKHDFEISNHNYLAVTRQNEELGRKIDKLEKANNNLNKDIIKEIIEANKTDVVCVLNLEIDRLRSENKLLGQTLEDMHEQIGKLEDENHDLSLANDTLVDELKEYSKKYEDDGQLSNKEVNEMLVDLGGVLAGYPCSDLKITFNL